MAGLWGADVERLRGLGRSFDDGAVTLTGVLTVLDELVARGSWLGPDAASFEADWHGRLRGMLAAAATDLERSAAQIAAHATEQDAASAVDGSAGAASAAGVAGASAGGAVGGGTPALATGVAPVPSDPVPGTPSPIAPYESALRAAGLLPRPDTEPLYWQWLENAARQGVDPQVLVDIATEFDIGPEDFEVLAGMANVFVDDDGKSFFLLPKDISAEDARRAVLMTYIFNAGTGYGSASLSNDFEETPYSVDEIHRIIDRQNVNEWSYSQDVAFVHGNGARLMTTPNGMMAGLGGNWLQGLYSQLGGTTYGDIFMFNIDNVDKPAATLGAIAKSGHIFYQDDGAPYEGTLDLDRLLHHEERHSQQWAQKGYGGFLRSYAWERITGGNETEEDAGLADGGYK